MPFGGYGKFPFRFGGGTSSRKVEHEALLDALSPVFSTDTDSANWAETYAHAQVLSSIWAANARHRNQAIPERMLEALTEWETICKLRPSQDDTAQERRRNVAAKLRGMVNNSIGDITDAVSTLLGSTFVSLGVVDVADEIVFWDGGTPGPPGYEWASNRVVLRVEVTKSGLSDGGFQAKMRALEELLDLMLPAWMTYQWSTGSGFVIDESLIGEAAL